MSGTAQHRARTSADDEGAPREERDRAQPHDVDAAVVAGGQPPSAKRRLNRERIVAAGLAYIDDFNVPGLTMRRLGTILGVEAMALYRYVPSKEDLLDGIVDLMIEEMRADPQMLDAPEHGWQDFLQRLAHGIRRVALAHPHAFPLLVARPPEAPWLRPPIRNLQWVDRFLSGLMAEGFSDEGAVYSYRAFTSFLLGHLLLEVAVHGADVGPLEAAQSTTAENHRETNLGSFPTVERLRDRLAKDESYQEFEESLENLLERLSLTLLEHPDGG